jgi:hypothetical protein
MYSDGIMWAVSSPLALDGPDHSRASVNGRYPRGYTDYEENHVKREVDLATSAARRRDGAMVIDVFGREEVRFTLRVPFASDGRNLRQVPSSQVEGHFHVYGTLNPNPLLKDPG